MEESTTAPAGDEAKPPSGKRVAGFARSTAAARGRAGSAVHDRGPSCHLGSEPGVEHRPLRLDPGATGERPGCAAGGDRPRGRHALRQARRGRPGDRRAPKVGPLIGLPLQTTVDSFIRTRTTEFVESPEFVKLWVGLNRRIHTQIDYILTGNRPSGDKALLVQGTKIELDLSGVVKAVEKRLTGLGLTIGQNIPVVGPTLEIANLHGIDKARSATCC